MSDTQDFTPAQVMAMGYKRIKSIAERFGINSPEVLAACERWGGILDDVNYPDSSCAHCGEPVQAVNAVYYHTKTKSKYCHNVAAAEATPKGWKVGDSEPIERKGVAPDLPVKPRPAPRKIRDNPQA